MFQLTNRTPFASDIAVLSDENGVDSLIVIVKASFRIGRAWQLLDVQSGPYKSDEYYGEPLTSSLKNASSYHLPKLSTDIIVKGSALALDGHMVSAVPVEVQVGRAVKRVYVFGNRYWDGVKISSPEAFESMPIVYENTYGGQLTGDSGTILDTELSNPVGRGLAGCQKILNGEIPFPNVEDLTQRITSPNDKVVPAGLGYVAPNWQPRVGFVGTYDDTWSKDRAPFFPLDFNTRFYSMASSGLVYPGYIHGSEPVSIRGMNLAGDLEFNLPEVSLNVRVEERGQDNVNLKLNIETLEILPNDLELNLTWKAIYISQKEISDIDNVVVSLRQRSN